MREARKSSAYDHAMGLFRSTMGLFRSRDGKSREKPAAELPNDQTRTAELPNDQTRTAELPNDQTRTAELPNDQTRTAEAQAEVVPREVKREARPNPDKPGWGQTISL
jgi:hypothetical protein